MTPVECCSRNGLVTGQYNLQIGHRFVYMIRMVLGIPKHPHYLETELYCLQNTASNAMAKAAGRRMNKTKKHGRALDMNLTLLVATHTLSAQHTRQSRTLNMFSWLIMVTRMRDHSQCTTIVYDIPLERTSQILFRFVLLLSLVSACHFA